MPPKKQKVVPCASKLMINGCVAENIEYAVKIPSKSVKVFMNIIKAVLAATSLQDTSELQIADHGIKYIVEESKSFQASTYLKKAFFESFFLKPKDKNVQIFNLGVNLRSFTELLSGILNDDDIDGMKMVYYGIEECISFSCKQTDKIEPLKENFELSDNANDSETFEPIDITTEYFVKTMHSTNPIDFSASKSKQINFLILTANEFHGIINDFDRTIDEMEIKVTEQRMTLKSIGILQYSTTVKLDPNSEIFIKYECETPSKFLYKFSYFKTMLKSLTMASKVSITTREDGSLRMQLLVQTEEEEKPTAFIEYNMLASLPDDDEEMDED